MTRGILVYTPDPGEARAYADLIRLPARAFTVHVAETPEQAAGPAAEAEILYGWRPPRGLLGAAKRLRWIQGMGAGVEHLLVPEVAPTVRITRVAGIFGPWMAEYAIAWALWTTQHIDDFRASQRERRWAPVNPIPLRGQTLCVVGLGDIGRTIATSARALGMRVIGVSRSGRGPREAERVYKTGALRKALARADFVVLTLPLSPATRGLVGAAELSAMKPSAWLINLARGPIVQEAALLDALRGRRIGGAVLDVFDTEPLPVEHPLWGFDNVVITPHISGPSTPPEIAPIFNDNLRRYVAGRPLRYLVDRARGY
ncbi:MAG TPA: D-2-hydroxyacid dehydrogenase [Candidatus Dormibacteraeota bacterium]|nr:D-2-hydroxyacid dehydrogenase [Candidatus Dormibacteraeota bacterium]